MERFPLQLGVVLVFFFFFFSNVIHTDNLGTPLTIIKSSVHQGVADISQHISVIMSSDGDTYTWTAQSLADGRKSLKEYTYCMRGISPDVPVYYRYLGSFSRNGSISSCDYDPVTKLTWQNRRGVMTRFICHGYQMKSSKCLHIS